MIAKAADSQSPVVLVTRPKQQAADFIELLKLKGIGAQAFPCIEIQALKLNAALKEMLQSINDYELIIFISANAVQQSAILLQQLGIQPDAVSVKIATIGRATLAVATELGFNVSLSPVEGFNSDALLALDELQSENIQQQRCLIIRGVGGLDYLFDELQKRGAQVSYAEVYRRNKPQLDHYLDRQKLSESWNEFRINAISVTSNESLQNLYDMLEQPGKTAMLNTPLIVASQRCLELAQGLGFTSVKRAQSAINQHMLEAVEKELE